MSPLSRSFRKCPGDSERCPAACGRENPRRTGRRAAEVGLAVIGITPAISPLRGSRTCGRLKFRSGGARQVASMQDRRLILSIYPSVLQSARGNMRDTDCGQKQGKFDEATRHTGDGAAMENCGNRTIRGRRRRVARSWLRCPAGRRRRLERHCPLSHLCSLFDGK
jgi:hypothetical protein